MAIYTIEQYNSLCAAIAEGVLRVEYADKKVEYRSINDMLKIKSLMEADLGLGKTTEQRRNTTSFNKGYQKDC